MIINIVAGSPFDINILKKHKANLNIGVDYGAYRLIENNIKLDIAFGDFDSISTDQFVRLLNSCSNVNKYKSEKAKTDSEIAIDYALSLEPDEINLFGVTGKRIDHFFGVLNLYKKAINHNILLNIIDEYNKIYVLKPGLYTIKKTEYKYISFLAYESVVTNLTLKNFKYELINHTIKNDDSLTISNEIKNEYGIVSFTEGNLIIVESND